jgi:ABC-type glycerol-3-phosphate transport system permease component
MMRGKPGTPILRAMVFQLIMILVTLVAVYPLLWLVLTSFKSKAAYIADQFGFPWPVFLGNFVVAFRGGRFARWLLNSVIVTAGGTIGSTLLACLSGFAFAKMPFKGIRNLLNLVIALMVVPPVVMILPLFMMYTKLALHSTFHGIILLYVGLTLPFSVYLITNFFKTIPNDLIEAGFMDGYSRIGILVNLIVPLSGAAILTLIITNALWIWNELLIALTFLAKDNMRTLMVGITTFKTRYMLDVPVTMAGLLMTTVPMLLLYAVFQRSFIRGLTEGSLKG